MQNCTYSQTCCLITKRGSIARLLIIPQKWSIACSSLIEIEVINWSLNTIIFRSQHLEHFSLFLYYCPSKLECLNKTQWTAVNHFFDVFAGLSIQQRQHSPFNLKITSISKLRPDNRVLFALKIKPAVLNTFACSRRWQCTIIFPKSLIKKKNKVHL
jgi:hypothetical protein